jgi:hypothetical protein
MADNDDANEVTSDNPLATVPGQDISANLGETLSRALSGAWHNVVIAGAAVKALAQLIGSASALGATMIDMKTASVKNTAEIEQAFRRALGAAAAEHAVNDAALVKEAADALFATAVRGQRNRTQIALRVVEDLKHDAPGSLPDIGPTDDFMNLFGDAASRASSDLMQGLFARILAGEIRQPGAFSLRTIQVISTFDQNAAARVQRMKPWVADKIIPFLGNIVRGEPYMDLKELSYIGVVDQAQSGSEVAAGGVTNLCMAGALIQFAPKSATNFRLPCYIVSQVGREIFGLLPNAIDILVAEHVAESLKAYHGIKNVKLLLRLDGLPCDVLMKSDVLFSTREL